MLPGTAGIVQIYFFIFYFYISGDFKALVGNQGDCLMNLQAFPSIDWRVIHVSDISRNREMVYQSWYL